MLLFLHDLVAVLGPGQTKHFTWTVSNAKGLAHTDISISTSINISIRKLRKVRVNRGHISIFINIRNETCISIFLCSCDERRLPPALENGRGQTPHFTRAESNANEALRGRTKGLSHLYSIRLMWSTAFDPGLTQTTTKRQRERHQRKGGMSGTMAVHVRYDYRYISLLCKTWIKMTKLCASWRKWTTTANFSYFYFELNSFVAHYRQTRWIVSNACETPKVK